MDVPLILDLCLFSISCVISAPSGVRAKNRLQSFFKKAFRSPPAVERAESDDNVPNPATETGRFSYPLAILHSFPEQG